MQEYLWKKEASHNNAKQTNQIVSLPLSLFNQRSSSPCILLVFFLLFPNPWRLLEYRRSEAILYLSLSLVILIFLSPSFTLLCESDSVCGPLPTLVKMFRRKSTTHNHHESEPVQSEAKVNELKAALGPLSGHSLQYCDDPCLRRYMEARSWNLEKAKKMLEETLKWRSSYKPEEIRWDEVAVEGETGKIYRAKFHDREGRSVLILRPAMQNTASLDNNIRHLVYLIENAILNLPECQEQMVWLIDFTGWSFSTSVPVKSAKDTINILQNHYPERLAMAFLYNPPRIFEAFWKIVKYFLDAKTFQKVKFVYPKNKDSVEVMRSFFDEENLPTEFGGKALLKYDHEEFSRMMAQDDLKAADLWRLDKTAEKLSLLNTANKLSGAEVAHEPPILAPSAS